MVSIQCLRSLRVFNIAVFDFVASLIGIFYLLKWLRPDRPRSYYVSWTVLTVLPLSVISHLLVDTPTMFNHYLGLSAYPVR
jgi:hypothetical protein